MRKAIHAARLLVAAKKVAEGKLHRVADKHASKLSVAVRYAFAKGRKALGPATNRVPNVDAAVKAVRAALEEVLPKTLIKVVEAGGEVALKSLKVLGGKGSGNFGHKGRPGEVGGSDGEGGSETIKDILISYVNAPWLNASLRSGKKLADHETVEVQKLDSLVKPISADTLYRYVSTYVEPSEGGESPYGTPDLAKKFIESLKPGQTILDPGFVSTSRLESYAKQVASEHRSYGAKSFVMELKLPKDAQGIDVEKVLGKSRVVDEFMTNAKEVILPRGTSFKVESVKGNRISATVIFGKSRRLEALAGIRFDQKNQRVIDWADRHAAELIDGITETTRDAINNAVAEALESGSIADLFDEILDAVGDENRADLIARTEVMTAANEGQREAWRQAADEGLLSENARVTWIATVDACPACEALDGTIRDLDGEYPDNGGDGPPLHPRCRCTEGIV